MTWLLDTLLSSDLSVKGPEQGIDFRIYYIIAEAPARHRYVQLCWSSIHEWGQIVLIITLR
jgi:hypothetical protein